jgi:hypothetical protein
VVAEAAGRSKAKIQVLKLVILQIDSGEDESPGGQVQAITDAPASGIGGDIGLTDTVLLA